MNINRIAIFSSTKIAIRNDKATAVRLIGSKAVWEVIAGKLRGKKAIQITVNLLTVYAVDCAMAMNEAHF